MSPVGHSRDTGQKLSDDVEAPIWAMPPMTSGATYAMGDDSHSDSNEPVATCPRL